MDLIGSLCYLYQRALLICTYTIVFMYIPNCTSAHIQTHKLTYPYTHIHIHTHTQIYPSNSNSLIIAA